MIVLTMDVTTVGLHVFQRLKQTKLGKVHSVFNTSFNLEFDERLIHVGSLDQGIAPFGIGLEDTEAKTLTSLIKMNESIYWRPDVQTLMFESGVSLRFREATIYKQNLYKTAISQTGLLERLEVFINAYKASDDTSGLFQSEVESKAFLKYLEGHRIDPKRIQNSPNTAGEMNERLLQLAQFVLEPKRNSLKEVFDYFVGRGPGLTPSGDDLLTGICAILSIIFDKNHPFFREFQIYIETYGKQRTTTVAYEYLSYVVNECAFHSSIHELLEVFLQDDSEAWKESIQNLQQMGHTSGIDTLLGMIIVLTGYAYE